MSRIILNNEPIIRLAFFVAVLVVVAMWEAVLPRRRRTVSRWVRWPSNLGIAALNTGLVRLAIPASLTAFALLGEQHRWGLLNNIGFGSWVRVVAAILTLDLAIYLQHVMFHAVPAFWRFHRMHHADIDFDVTTGSRFHPVEIILSMGFKFAVVVTLGAPAVSVVLFEVLLNTTAMFNHSNAHVPETIDRVIRWFVVTPDMHRVHHSVAARETNSNFGFNLPWWDRILGTYRAQPEAGHEDMIIGLDIFRDTRQLRLDRMLAQPFVAPAGAYPITSPSPVP